MTFLGKSRAPIGAIGCWGYENFLLLMGVSCLYRSTLCELNGWTISTAIFTLAAAVFLVGHKLVEKGEGQTTLEINGATFSGTDDNCPAIRARRAS
jgi:hypothetical protein